MARQVLFAGGRLSNHDQARPVALDAYDSMAERYAAEIEENPRSIYYERPALLDLLPAVSGRRVLDAGCGPGVMVAWFLAQGAEVVGVDASAKMVSLARQRVGAGTSESDLTTSEAKCSIRHAA